ncbi:diacylglycerol acyltransferase [Rhynchospora pubera]|uniref:Diacylglycerol acyltransferase n=1 Tax=Rhynchospora pubera TaxID=906938 RepID=A0AAV8CSR5_9POAL|nr:diacylglycerol acyltransferase [Rhynchospora pubera]
MEISGAVLGRSSTGSVHHRLLFGRSDAGAPRRPSSRVRVPGRATCGGAVFLDEGHLKYYDERREQEKKRAKLIKTLKKDLSQLYSMGFGIDNDQSDKIEEAAKQLLEQLNQIKVEEKEMKKNKKEEKKAKAACEMVCDKDSSSSSSESSESDCEEPRILQLSDLKATTTATLTVPNPVSPAPVPLPLPAPAPAPLPLPAPALALMQTVPVADVLPAGKIEVCMGGKCKKSGSMDLLREFEMMVGNEGDAVVVGCKCMGKCKEGPNVRVSGFDSGTTGTTRGESVSIMRDQLCIGVGLDDVGTIVAHFFRR